MITGNKPRLRDMVIPHNPLGDRIRELEAELNQADQDHDWRYWRKQALNQLERFKDAEQRIAKATAILKASSTDRDLRAQVLYALAALEGK